MQYPLAIRIEPGEKNKFPQICRSMVVDKQSAAIIYAEIRRCLKLKKTESVFLFNTDLLVTYNSDLKELYDRKKDTDGFLYVYYTDVNPF